MKKRRALYKNILSDLTPLMIRHRAEEASGGLPALMAAAEKAVATFHAGDHHQRKAGSGENFWQFREYDPGDLPQDIDWRQSGKSDHLYIRQKEKQTAQSVLFWVQTDKGMQIRHGRALASKHETGIIISMALALLLTRAGERVGALSEPNRLGRGEPALQHLGETLWRKPIALTNGPQLPIVGTLPKYSSAVLCGDFMQPPDSLDLTLGLLATQAQQGLLIQILDPSEADLPFNGRMVFRSIDEQLEFPISHVPSIRRAYQERLQNHIDTVHMIARRHGYAHIVHVTRDNPREILPEAWRALAPQPRLQAGGAA